MTEQAGLAMARGYLGQVRTSLNTLSRVLVEFEVALDILDEAAARRAVRAADQASGP